MAKELLLTPDGTILSFIIYPSAPIVIGGEPQLLTFPSSQLPESVVNDQWVTPAYVAMIDGGRVAWEEHSIPRASHESGAQYLARLKKKYAAWKARTEAHIQQRVDAAAAARWVNLG
jgi:hypothetical protein